MHVSNVLSNTITISLIVNNREGPIITVILDGLHNNCNDICHGIAKVYLWL